MEHDCSKHQLMINAAHKFDPTRTLGLRDRFSNQFKKRFKELQKEIVQEILVSNLFVYPDIETYGLLEDFKNLMGRVKSTIRYYLFGETIVNESWIDKYIKEAYQKGVYRARVELRNAGFNVPTIEASGGISISLTSAKHSKQIYFQTQQTLLEMETLAANLETVVSKIVTQSALTKESPEVVANKIIKVISGKGTAELPNELSRFIAMEYRAATLARTNVVRSHHLAMVNEFQNWEIENVILMAEFITAGDDKVCPICSELAGTYRLEDTIDMIPVHPNCRCIILPVK